MTTRARFCLVLAALAASASLRAAGAPPAPPAPAREAPFAWKTASPASQGMDGAALGRLDTAFARGEHGYVDSFLVVRHGVIVLEKAYRNDYDRLFATAPDKTRGMYGYYDPDWHPWYRRGPLHTMQSVSKSVTSALVGIAMRRGEIADPGVQVLPFLEGYAVDADARRSRLTLEHLLTMRAGIRWNEDDYTSKTNSCILMEGSRDWVRFTLDQPMAAEPGADFVYNGGATQLIARVLARATGTDVEAYAKRELFAPLGIDTIYWKHTPTGLVDAEGGLYLAPRDLAKIGLLYLKDGVWDGRRILPERWAAASTQPRVHLPGGPRPPAWGYGYQWWTIAGPGVSGYAALGYGGQQLLVVPSLDLVVVLTGWNVYDKPELDPGVAMERLAGAVQRP